MTIKGIGNLSVAELQEILAAFNDELQEARVAEDSERIQRCEVNVAEVGQEIVKRVKGN